MFFDGGLKNRPMVAGFFMADIRGSVR